METTAKFRNLMLSAAIICAATASAQETTTTMTTTTKTTTEVKPDYDQGFRLGFGVNAGYMFNPSDTFGDTDIFNGLALGGDVRLQYDFSKRISVTLTTGYNHFFIDKDIKDLPFTEFCDIGQIPVKAGFKVFFWEDQFYGLAEAGAGFTVSKNSPFEEDTTVILSPGIGWANKWVDLSLRYEHYTEFEAGQVALRLAYGFRL